MDNNYNNLQKMVLKPSEAIAYIFCYKIVLMFYNVFGLGEGWLPLNLNRRTNE